MGILGFSVFIKDIVKKFIIPLISIFSVRFMKVDQPWLNQHSKNVMHSKVFMKK